MAVKSRKKIDISRDNNPRPVEAYMMTSKLKRLVRDNKEQVLQMIADKRSVTIKSMEDVLFRLDILNPDMTKEAYALASEDVSKLSRFIFKSLNDEK